MHKNSELSTPAILGISVAFAMVGLLLYALIVPLSPATRVQMAFMAFQQQVIQ